MPARTARYLLSIFAALGSFGASNCHAAERLTVVSYNVKSGDADLDVVSRRVADSQQCTRGRHKQAMKLNQWASTVDAPDTSLISDHRPLKAVFIQPDGVTLSPNPTPLVALSSPTNSGLAAAASGIAAPNTLVSAAQAPTTVLLVRHAEKAPPPPSAPSNPPLSDLGLKRAKELARVLGNSGVQAIFATEFSRTQQTIQPLASKLGLTMIPKPANATTDLVNEILTQHSGQVVVVAGHSDTVPAIIAALGGGTVPTIQETEFDNLYVVTIQGSGQAKVVRLKYGAPSP